MNKKELVKLASLKSGVPQLTLLKCLDILVDAAAQSINEGESITIANFGTLRVTRQKERYVRNPSTGDTKLKAPTIKVSFRTSLALIKTENIEQQLAEE